jgi:hypothetical protein
MAVTNWVVRVGAYLVIGISSASHIGRILGVTARHVGHTEGGEDIASPDL